MHRQIRKVFAMQVVFCHPSRARAVAPHSPPGASETRASHRTRGHRTAAELTSCTGIRGRYLTDGNDMHTSSCRAYCEYYRSPSLPHPVIEYQRGTSWCFCPAASHCSDKWTSSTRGSHPASRSELQHMIAYEGLVEVIASAVEHLLVPRNPG